MTYCLYVIVSFDRLTRIYQEEGRVTGDIGVKKSQKSRSSIDRIHHLHSAMSKGIPTHSLIELVSKSHTELAQQSPHCIIALADILKVRYKCFNA